MKYTIELTSKQKAVIECLLEIVRKHIGFNARLEPMEVKAVNVEDTNEYQIGYKAGYDLAVKNAQETKLTLGELAWCEQEYNRGLEDGKKQGYQKGKADGYKLGVADGKSIMQTVPEDLLHKERQDGYNQGFEDGKNEAIHNTELIPELKKCNYTLGYNQALDDASDLIAFFGYNFMHECYPEECEIFYSLYDLNAKYGLAEILEKWKAYTKQQKEVENYHKLVDTLRTITDAKYESKWVKRITSQQVKSGLIGG